VGLVRARDWDGGDGGESAGVAHGAEMVGELAEADLFEVLVEVAGESFGEFEVVLHGVLSPFVVR
jgi:hypothetical protein